MREKSKSYIRRLGSAFGTISSKTLPLYLRVRLAKTLGLAVHLPSVAANFIYEFSFSFAKNSFKDNKEILLRRSFENFVMELDISQKIQRQLFYLKMYEPSVSNFIKKNLGKNDVFMDIGTHVGYYSMLVSRIVGEGGIVVSLEPETKNLARLSNNISVNNIKNIKILGVAAGESEGVADFYINPLNEGGGSLLEFEKYRDGSDIYDKSDIEKKYKSVPLHRKVPVNSPDNLIASLDLSGKINLIKIDTEGAELKVLRGCIKEFGNNNNLKIICEVSTDRKPVFDLVKQFGFDIFRLNEAGEAIKLKDGDDSPKTNYVFKKS